MKLDPKKIILSEPKMIKENYHLKFHFKCFIFGHNFEYGEEYVNFILAGELIHPLHGKLELIKTRVCQNCFKKEYYNSTGRPTINQWCDLNIGLSKNDERNIKLKKLLKS